MNNYHHFNRNFVIKVGKQEKIYLFWVEKNLIRRWSFKLDLIEWQNRIRVYLEIGVGCRFLDFCLKFFIKILVDVCFVPKIRKIEREAKKKTAMVMAKRKEVTRINTCKYYRYATDSSRAHTRIADDTNFMCSSNNFFFFIRFIFSLSWLWFWLIR